MSRARTYIDSGLLIAAWQGNHEISGKAIAILDDPDRALVVSDAVWLEVMPKCRYQNNDDECEFYEEIFSAAERLTWQTDVLYQAHDIAQRYDIAAMDAIHVASAVDAAVDQFVSGEKPTKPNYPALSNQTLYTAVNDFVEPKLKRVAQSAQALRGVSGRSVVEERELEQLQDLAAELGELRDTLLEIARDYHPHHDDGVQITAAPLWPLFRHKPWQKVLKETWAKLEKGDYDWAHLAMHYWPERVREKCRSDKSLAIAHGLEALYEEPPAAPKKAKRGRGTA